MGRDERDLVRDLVLACAAFITLTGILLGLGSAIGGVVDPPPDVRLIAPVLAQGERPSS